MRRLELLTSPCCPHCAAAIKHLHTAVADQASEEIELRESSVLADIDRAVDLGIRRTPALVLDGRLIHQGPLSERQLQRLAKALPCPE